MKKPFGGVKELPLVTTHRYSLETIQVMVVKEFNISSTENTILENSTINLGYFDGSIVEFKNSVGEPCDIWEFCKTEKTILSKLKLYLLTSKDENELRINHANSAQTVTSIATHTSKKYNNAVPYQIIETQGRLGEAETDNLTNNLLNDEYKDAEIDNLMNDLINDEYKDASEPSIAENGSKSTPNFCPEMDNSATKSNNIRTFYTCVRRSKYSNEYSVTEVDKNGLYSYVYEDQPDIMPPIEKFDPLTNRFEITRIEKRGEDLLAIAFDENLKKTYNFPSAKLSPEQRHKIAHDVDEVHGYSEGKFGLGVVPNCTNNCHPEFTWYRDGEVFVTGKSLYCVNDVCALDNDEHIWSCGITCSENKSGSMSKSIKVRQEKILADIDCNPQQPSGCIPLITKGELLFSKTLLGAGAQGKVWKGTWLGTDVAIKTIKNTSTNNNLIAREIAILEYIRHPNIIQVMAFCRDPKQFHIVTEYFPSSSLSDVLFDDDVKEEYCLSTDKKDQICYQICEGIAYLHAQQIPIIHRDIKPDNILVNKELIVKICDLGLSKFGGIAALTTTIGHSKKGTLLYMAPEILLEKKEATMQSDIWAIGCTLIEIYTETFVWNIDCKNPEQSLRNQLQAQKIPDLTRVPLELKHVLEQ